MNELDLLPGCAFAAVEAADWRDLLSWMGERVIAAGHAEPTFTAALIEREANFPTGLPTPVPTAIPHADPQHVRRAGVAVATLAEPVEFLQMGGTGESLGVRVVVMLCMTDGKAQVDALQLVLARLGDQDAVDELLAADEHPNFEEFVRGWLTGSG